MRTPKSILTEEDILRYMKERTSRVKWLCGIEFTSSIPKNPVSLILPNTHSLSSAPSVDTAYHIEYPADNV